MKMKISYLNAYKSYTKFIYKYPTLSCKQIHFFLFEVNRLLGFTENNCVNEKSFMYINIFIFPPWKNSRFATGRIVKILSCTCDLCYKS